MPSTPETEVDDPDIAFAVQRLLLDRVRQNPPSGETAVLEDEHKVCSCIDEGTPGDFRLAGAGITDPAGFDHAVKMMR